MRSCHPWPFAARIANGRQESSNRAVELRGDRFELLRALTGRRTVQEITSLAWTGDVKPYIELVPNYPVTRNSLSES